MTPAKKTTSTTKTTTRKTPAKTMTTKTPAKTATPAIDYKSLYEQTLLELNQTKEQLSKFITPMDQKDSFKKFQKYLDILFKYNDNQKTNRFKIYISQSLICDVSGLNAVSAKEYMAHFKESIDNHNEKNGTNSRKSPMTKDEIKEYCQAVIDGDTEKENTFYY